MPVNRPGELHGKYNGQTDLVVNYSLILASFSNFPGFNTLYLISPPVKITHKNSR